MQCNAASCSPFYIVYYALYGNSWNSSQHKVMKALVTKSGETQTKPSVLCSASVVQCLVLESVITSQLYCTHWYCTVLNCPNRRVLVFLLNCLNYFKLMIFFFKSVYI